MDIKEIIGSHYEEAVALRRQFHQNPELSHQEYMTTRLIRSTLERYGIEIEELPVKTGVSAIIRTENAGKTVVLREDIDALPMMEETGLPFASQVSGVCHACGHDLHAACLLLAAIALNECKDQLRCNVRFLFQPAEEVMTGAASMLDGGLAQLKPKGDMIIGVHTSPYHPVGSISLFKGAANASSDQLEITVRGTGGHGAYPHRVVDPIVAAGMLLTQLQTIVSRENLPFAPAVLSFGSIHGGTAPNIIPGEVVLTGMLRTFDEDQRRQMLDSIQRISECCCQAMRAEAEVKVVCGIPVLRNDHAIVDGIETAARKTIGEERIFWQKQASPGSDDFSVFLGDMPGAQFLIGTANQHPDSRIGLHHPKGIFDEQGICVGALVMSQFVLDQ